MSLHHEINSTGVLQPGVSEPAAKTTQKKTERIIVFVLGGPGSGKGTQVTSHLMTDTKIPHHHSILSYI